jgi:outer membrane protein assembly factor BamB
MSLCDDCITAAEEERVVARSQAQDDAARAAASQSVDQLIFVGLNGYALALDRDTGQIVWSNSQMKSGYVSLLLDGDRLIVSTNGYIYCLDPLTGKILWHNPLTGYGMGAPTHLISVRGQSSQTQVQQAAEAEAASNTAHAGGV